MTPQASGMQTEAALQAVQERIERHDSLVLPWIELWRGMGYGPDLIAQLLQAAKVEPPRSRWSANAVRRIAARNGVDWGRRQGIRSFMAGRLAPGLLRAESASLPRRVSDLGSDAQIVDSLKSALLKGLDLLREGRL